MDKETMVYNGLLSSHKSDILLTYMDESWGYYAKWNKSEKDKYFTHMWNLKKLSLKK